MHKDADSSLAELFRSEVETHTATLTEGLLSIENDAGAVGNHIESLMRAVHSIKGGARIVDLDAAVKIAHSMEDCFAAVRKGEITLKPTHIDVLLKAADMLGQISESAVSGKKEWDDIQIENIVSAIASVSAGEFRTNLPSVTTSQPAMPVRKIVIGEVHDKDRMVRVSAGKIERLMGLAGEVVVSARWLPTFFDSLMMLKKDNMRLNPEEFNRRLMEHLNRLDMFANAAASLSDRLYHEMVGVRMCPFSEGTRGFPRLVRDLARELDKKVHFAMYGEATEVDRDILEKLEAPLTHLLRNAIDHGIESPHERIAAGKPETGVLRLEAMHRAGMLMITIYDDGRGIDPDAIRQKVIAQGLVSPDMADRLTENELTEFLFLPGFSTSEKITEISGRGVGLDVVHTMVNEAGGNVRAISGTGKGMTFQLELPLTLSVIRTFLVEISQEPYAFPLARIDRCLKLEKNLIKTVEDRQYFKLDGTNISLIDIRDILELDTKSSVSRSSSELCIVLISDSTNTYGLAVDDFLGECDLVVRPLDARLGKVPNLSAVAVMMDGSPVLIFDVEDLVRSMDNLANRKQALSKIGTSAKKEKKKYKRILVADDSATVREKERSLLEIHGYQAEVAVDGMDAWRLLNMNSYDMVLSDIDMPRMNGFELLKRIRQDARFKSLPVVIVSYKDTEEDRLRGLEAGANYYLRKRSFDDNSLIQSVADLIGDA